MYIDLTDRVIHVALNKQVYNHKRHILNSSCKQDKIPVFANQARVAGTVQSVPSVHLVRIGIARHPFPEHVLSMLVPPSIVHPYK